MITYRGTARDWVTRGGAPARCLGNPKRYGGLPSYEHEDGALVVYDLLVAAREADGGMMLLSRWYHTASVIAPEGMVPLHHDPEAWWKWRPCIYRRSMYRRWLAMGSQKELGWRYGMQWIQQAATIDDIEEFADFMENFPMTKANERAEALLQSMLTDFQLVEWRLASQFRVRGAATGNLYAVGHGDGFTIVDEVTNEAVVSYCLHPEYWVPEADVSLATKLALEDPELEVKTLENATMTPIDPVVEPTPELEHARDLERELIR